LVEALKLIVRVNFNNRETPYLFMLPSSCARFHIGKRVSGESRYFVAVLNYGFIPKFRFPKGSFLMVLIVILVFIVLQLMTSESTPSTEFKSTPNNPRVAIVTFTTDEHSYTHLSLKNKNRKLSVS
jgi:hypothetical protein